MSRFQIHFALVLLSAAFATVPIAPALAQKGERKAKPRVAKPAAPIVKKKTKNYDFMADDIEASRIRPDGTAIFGLTNVSHKSLISLRSEFIGEILKSARQL